MTDEELWDTKWLALTLVLTGARKPAGEWPMPRRPLDYEVFAHAIMLADNLRALSYRDALKALGVEDPNSHECKVLRCAVLRLIKDRYERDQLY